MSAIIEFHKCLTKDPSYHSLHPRQSPHSSHLLTKTGNIPLSVLLSLSNTSLHASSTTFRLSTNVPIAYFHRLFTIVVVCQCELALPFLLRPCEHCARYFSVCVLRELQDCAYHICASCSYPRLHYKVSAVQMLSFELSRVPSKLLLELRRRELGQEQKRELECKILQTCLRECRRAGDEAMLLFVLYRRRQSAWHNHSDRQWAQHHWTRASFH